MARDELYSLAHRCRIRPGPRQYKAFARSEKVDKAAGAAARSVMVGTQWLQWRLASSGAGGIEKADNRCKACDGGELGALRRRRCLCSPYHQIRDKHLSMESIKKLRAGVGEHIYVKHALMMKKKLPAIPKRQYSHPSCINEAAPKWFRGTIYVDGSGNMCRWLKDLSSAARAAAIIRDDMADIKELGVEDTELDEPI